MSNNINKTSPALASLSPTHKNLVLELKSALSRSIFISRGALSRKLSGVKPIELNAILLSTLEEILQENSKQDPLKAIDKLSKMVPMQTLQLALRNNPADAFKEAKSLLKEGALLLENQEGNKLPKSQRLLLKKCLEKITTVIESLIAAFGMGDFFRPADNEAKNEFKSQKIMMILSLFTMVASILPLLGAGASAVLILGGILLSIAAISIIWPLVKPKTTHLPANALNLTHEVQSGTFVPGGRKESLDQIANLLKSKRHAILVGPSRVGKSLTARAFAQAVARGDYPELAGKTVFLINTTELIGQKASFLGGGNTILKEISDAMGRHRKDIILVFDEIHMVCKNGEKMADQLKTYLDEGGPFPHVIGITTELEYQKHVKDNVAFSLRFDPVPIKNMDRDETLKTLAETVLKQPVRPAIKQSALEKIYALSSQDANAPQPATAIKLLKNCLNMTTVTQLSETDRKIVQISNRILSLQAQKAACSTSPHYSQAEIEKLEKELAELKNRAAVEQKAKADWLAAKELQNKIAKETYLTALKVSSASDTFHLRKFLLLQSILKPLVTAQLEKWSKIAGTTTVIDDALVEKAALVN